MQTTNTILMIRPMQFGLNIETAESNAFQDQQFVVDKEEARHKAMEEFDAFVVKLRAHGIQVIVVEDLSEPVTPDAVFPNNWISFHQDGTIVLYPMMAPNRRLERREDVIKSLTAAHGFKESRRIDLTAYEAENLFLEGTGSMVLDRKNRIAYACLSPRTDETILNDFCGKMNYRLLAFEAVDQNDQLIYHTNVMMCVGESIMVVCHDAIKTGADQKKFEDFCTETEKEVVSINFDQMNNFAGNMLEVKNEAGEHFMVMSQQAYDSLFDYQIEVIEKYCKIISAPLNMIETLGGGSARCMMAEVFLPKYTVN